MRLIISYHNFKRTPANLGAVKRQLSGYGRDAIKIATHCNSLRDALRVLALCKGRRDVIAVPMGEIGLPTRVLALKHGKYVHSIKGQHGGYRLAKAPDKISLAEVIRLFDGALAPTR